MKKSSSQSKCKTDENPTFEKIHLLFVLCRKRFFLLSGGIILPGTRLLNELLFVEICGAKAILP
jgi:hypothetical protein